ncbi:MAG: nitrilase-related carbon-nitrogen hydrolase, partial [Pirellulaceae bacterium]|nr:nitrilase-related carbon-nitrogen hydrolase [Pirellulaceae bacterium]
MKKLKVASVQFEHKDGKTGENLAKISEFVKQARSSGTDLIVFPECCISGMTFLRDLSRIELLDIAESVPNGPSIRELSRLAAENEIMIGAGLVEVGDDGEIYNTYVVAMPNGDHHSHRKLHCFISPHMKSGSQLLTFD